MEVLGELAISSSSEDSEDGGERPLKRVCFSSSMDVQELEAYDQTDNRNTSKGKGTHKSKNINDRTCSQCSQTFANAFNRERHEETMHSIRIPPPSESLPPSSVSSPIVTRSRKGKQKAREYPRIFDYDKNPEAKRLRDEGIKEQAEKAKARNEERKKAMEERRLALEEKRKLALENEQRRNEEKEARKQRSETALAALVDNRKRKR